MNELGLAVEDLTRVGEPIPGIVTAKVLETRAHPQAERVHEVFVDTGDGEPLHVWCGAFNMQAGDVVPLATIGTTMPNGQQIGRRKILGVASEGMLCSAAELGLGDDHSGILILPPGTELGVPVEQALGASADAVFDLDVTRNRPDAYGHLGVARDVAAHLGVPFHPPSRRLVADGPERSAPVEIVAPDLCGRFVSVVLSGLRVGPSARLDGRAPHPGRDAADQQRRRRLELRDARAERAEPRVRPGRRWAAGASASAAPSTARRW